MLRYREKEDFEARFRQVDQTVEAWREAEAAALPAVVAEFREKLLIGLIYHDAAIEGEVLSHGEIKAAIDTNIISDISLIPSYEEISNFSRACAAASELAANSVAHAGGVGWLRVWRGDGHLFVDVSDRGHLTEPLLGRIRPSAEQERGRGLWLANQLCDLVQVRSSAGGTTVRLRAAHA